MGRGWWGYNRGGGGYHDGIRWKNQRKPSKKASKKRQSAFAPTRTQEYVNDLDLPQAMGLDLPPYIGNNVTLPFDDDDDDSDLISLNIPQDDSLDREILYGNIKGNVVGTQYYKGTVNRNEMVALVREPNNRYDKNAVKVVNLDGVQVGHIKRELANPLAYIIDHGLCRVEGIVPSGMDNIFSLPVELSFWGAPEHRGEVISKMKQCGYYLKEAPIPETANMGLELGQGACLGAGPSVPSSAYQQPQRTLLTAAEMTNELDKLFETLQEHDKTSEMECTEAISTTLFKHQKQALKWMTDKENGKSLPPFWEEKDGGFYFNSLTVTTTKNRPPSVRGGILADDMGLGKTLEIIALVLTNFLNNKPLAKPVPGRVRQSAIDKKRRLEGYRKNKIGYEDRVEAIGASSGVSKRKMLYIRRGQSLTCTNKEMKEEFICDDINDESDLSSEASASQSSESDEDEQIPAGESMMKTEDPEYVPVIDTDTDTVQCQIISPKRNTSIASSRPKRNARKPAKYIFSDSEEEAMLNSPGATTAKKDENYETPSKKAKTSLSAKDIQSVQQVTLCHSDENVQSQGNAKPKSKASIHGKGKGKGKGKGVSGSSQKKVLKVRTNNVNQQDQEEDKMIVIEELPDLPSFGQLQPTDDGKPPGKPHTLVNELPPDPDLPSLPDLECIQPDNSKTLIVIGDDGHGQQNVTEMKDDGRTMTEHPRTTLIVCPLSVISNWTDQFETHIHECVHLKFYTFYGPNRKRDAKFLATQDVVFTTYNVLAADMKGRDKILQKVDWLRIVLDEGHIIRNPATQMCQAAVALKAQRRWVLSGTPIQNSMKDLWSLVNFLKISPFTDKVWWHRTIERPLSRGESAGLVRVQHLMGHVALRRTKTQEIDGKPIVKLPKRDVYQENIIFSEEERKVYEAMQNEGKLIIGKYFRQGKLLHHYGEVLAILMRLRQLCCHPKLVAKAAQFAETIAEETHGDELTEEMRKKLIEALKIVLGSGSDEECPICLDSLKDAVITRCAHVFCRVCIQRCIEQDKDMCPLCRANVDMEQVIRTADLEIENAAAADDGVSTGEWQSSSKVDALMVALVNLRKEDPTVKSLVVSQFTSFLTVIETPLKENGFKFVRLDGTMTAPRRVRAIEMFSDPTPGGPTIFLLSLKAGGVGLNLTAANRVYLLDPAWNPATEEQCFDRVHRLGQTRDVVITKFIVMDSVEVRMQELQERKRQLMQGAFKKQSREQRQRQRINEIKTLIDL